MLKEIIFGISSIKGPTWLKEFNENNKQLEDLKMLVLNYLKEDSVC